MGAAFGREALVAGIKMKSPRCMRHRFVTEDVPYGLILFSGLGDLVDVAMRSFHAIIALFCSVIDGTDYWEEGGGLRELGLNTLSAEGLLGLLRDGERA